MESKRENENYCKNATRTPTIGPSEERSQLFFVYLSERLSQTVFGNVMRVHIRVFAQCTRINQQQQWWIIFFSFFFTSIFFCVFRFECKSYTIIIIEGNRWVRKKIRYALVIAEHWLSIRVNKIGIEWGIRYAMMRFLFRRIFIIHNRCVCCSLFFNFFCFLALSSRCYSSLSYPTSVQLAFCIRFSRISISAQ